MGTAVLEPRRLFPVVLLLTLVAAVVAGAKIMEAATAAVGLAAVATEEEIPQTMLESLARRTQVVEAAEQLVAVAPVDGQAQAAQAAPVSSFSSTPYPFNLS